VLSHIWAIYCPEFISYLKFEKLICLLFLNHYTNKKDKQKQNIHKYLYVIINMSITIRFRCLFKTLSFLAFKTRGELRYSGRVSSSCSTSDPRSVNLVTNPVISHAWGKDREASTTSGTYPWSYDISFQVEIKSSISECTRVYRIAMLAIPLSYLFIMNIFEIPLNW